MTERAWTPPFVDSLFEIGERLVFGSNVEEVIYVKEPLGGGTALLQLRAGHHDIAVGDDIQLSQVESEHRRLHGALKGDPIIRDIRAARKAYETAFRQQTDRIEVKVQQRAFLPGPCEICEAWGGLPQ